MPPSLLSPENDYSSLLDQMVDAANLSVAVIVPVYNRVELLTLTMAGIASQSYPSDLISVVVADDGSEEDVAHAVARESPGIGVEVVRREHDGYGAGMARNLGASAAGDVDLLVFLDADCIPDTHAIQRHAVWHHLASNLVVVGSRHHVDTTGVTAETVKDDPSHLRQLAFGDPDPDLDRLQSDDFRRILHRRTASLKRGDVAFRSLVSSNFSVRKHLFVSSGGFSSDFRRWGGEDTELGWRLWNDGVYFIDEPQAAVYHQTQTDAGDDGWRQRSRAANDALIQSKIPHRHYRQTHSGAINQAPKTSVVVHGVVPQRLDELAGQILNQRLGDLEMVIIDTDERSSGFLERRLGDPRFAGAEDAESAVEKASGEFVALVHGAAGIDHRLVSRSVKALENRPNIGWVRSAYGIPTTVGYDVYGRRSDTDQLDRSWAGGLPIFGFTRRRDLMKGLRSGLDLQGAWEWVVASLDPAAHSEPLVVIPEERPTDSHPTSIEPPRPLRSQVLSDLKDGGERAIKAPIRAARALLTGGPYHRTPVEPATPPKHESADDVTRIRYVGWPGNSNLGDEAMLDAVRDLFSWGEVETTGDAADLLMLGGGTLINRGYLRQLRPLDSPRIERVAFGPGVANPSFWGEPKERSRDWVDFLGSCAYVGVRGPASANILESWGLKSDMEIVGDPALSLKADPSVERIDGRIVVCPAWTKGLLWGESDEQVFASLADLIKKFAARGNDVWVLSAFPGDDRFIIDIMRMAGAPDLPYLAAHEDSQEAVDLLATAELVVAERLHGAVLAAAAGALPVMVEYRPKLRDFAQSVALEELVIRTDELHGDALIELVDVALAARERYVVEMNAHVESFRVKQRNAADRIHALMTK